MASLLSSSTSLRSVSLVLRTSLLSSGSSSTFAGVRGRALRGAAPTLSIRWFHATSPSCFALKKKFILKVRRIEYKKKEFGKKIKDNVDKRWPEDLETNVPKLPPNAHQVVLSHNTAYKVYHVFSFLLASINIGYWINTSFSMSRLLETDLVFSPMLTYSATALSALLFLVVCSYNSKTVFALSFYGPDAGKMMFQTLSFYGSRGKVRTIKTGAINSVSKTFFGPLLTMRLKNQWIPHVLTSKRGVQDSELLERMKGGGQEVMAASIRRAFPAVNKVEFPSRKAE